MSSLAMLVVCAVVFIVSWRLSRWLSSPDCFFAIIDHPNERSLHSRPVPRTGGLAIIIAAGVGIGLLPAIAGVHPNPALGWLGLSTTLVAGISLLDDRYDLSSGGRIAVHFIAAWLLIEGNGWALDAIEFGGRMFPLWHGVGLGLSVLFVVWTINLYNFMDGMDGFAAGMAVIGFAALALIGFVYGDGWSYGGVSLVVAAAALGFLTVNFPPARIFMGDVGSSTLGLAVAAVILWGSALGYFELWLGVLIFSPFYIDATVTLVRRILGGEKFWQAHRSHYYQRLVQFGWGHRRTTVAEYLLMLACASTAYFATGVARSYHLWIALFWICVYAGFMWMIGYAEKRKERHS